MAKQNDAGTGPNSIREAPDGDASSVDGLLGLTARLEAQLDRIEAEGSEPARSRLIVEAVLTGRSVYTQWNALKEHLPYLLACA